MLEQAAANRWGVEVTEVKADLHKIVHVDSGKSLGFGDLVEGRPQAGRARRKSAVQRTRTMAVYRQTGQVRRS